MKFKTNVCLIIIGLFCLNVNSQKLSTTKVNSKLIKSWTATEVGSPNQEMFPKRNKEIMDFKADGILQIKQESKMMGLMEMKVKWFFDKKMQRLIISSMIDGKKESQELEILELTDSRLVLTTEHKKTVYIPTNMIVSNESSKKSPSNENTNKEVLINIEALNPNSWAGSLNYNTVLLGDDNTDVEKASKGLIALSIENGQKIITKTSKDGSIIWKVTSDMEIAGLTRYSVDCSDPKLAGEITFQNGGLMLEMYEPTYSSMFFISK